MHLDAACADVLASTGFPKDPVAADLVQAQRLNREIRRRTDVDGILPGRDSRIHLVGAILAGQHTKGETAATLASTSWPAPGPLPHHPHAHASGRTGRPSGSGTPLELGR